MNLVAVGRIGGCFGLKGFLKVTPLTETSARFVSLRVVAVGTAPESTRELEIEELEFRNGMVVVKFASISDRTAAEQLRGAYIFVDEEERARPQPGVYYIDDLIGCRVQSVDGSPIGVLREVYRLPGHDLWEIAGESGSFLLPAVKEYVKNVDTGARTITVSLIDGMSESGTRAV